GGGHGGGGRGDARGGRGPCRAAGTTLGLVADGVRGGMGGTIRGAQARGQETVVLRGRAVLADRAAVATRVHLSPAGHPLLIGRPGSRPRQTVPRGRVAGSSGWYIRRERVMRRSWMATVVVAATMLGCGEIIE